MIIPTGWQQIAEVAAQASPRKHNPMSKFVFLSPKLAVAGAMTPDDFAEARLQGFQTIINNRPDGEEAEQLTAHFEATLAWRAGIAYRHIPAAKHEVLDEEVLQPFAEALTSAKGPILLHCRSGLRSTIMWAALQVQAGQPLDDVLAAAKAAGFDLDPVRDEIAERRSAVEASPIEARRAAA